MSGTLMLKAKELAKHAQRIATATGCHVIPRAVSNPTLVHHGLVAASRWHILTHEPPRRAVADLYIGSKAEAHRVARLLANTLGVQLEVLDNAAVPKDTPLKQHPRALAEPNRRKRPPRANRKGRKLPAHLGAKRPTVPFRRGPKPKYGYTASQLRAIVESRKQRGRLSFKRKPNPKGRKRNPYVTGSAFYESGYWTFKRVKNGKVFELEGLNPKMVQAFQAAAAMNDNPHRVMFLPNLEGVTAADVRLVPPRRSDYIIAQFKGATPNRRRPKKNPRSTLERAADKFRQWQDRGPIEVRTERLRRPDPLPDAAAQLGELVALTYRTDKYDGKTKDHEHVFSKPLARVVTDPAGRELYIVRGKSRYGITPDGITN